MLEMISFSENFVDEAEKTEIAEILPQWETHVLNIQRSTGAESEVESINFLVAAKSKEEFRKWLTEFEEKTKVTYSVRHSRTGKGQRVTYKLCLLCQHNTRSERVFDPAVNKGIKNTNCPSKMYVSVYAVHDGNSRKRCRGRFGKIRDILRRMPCEVRLTLKHNHSITSAASLRFRQPSNEVKETLKSLFKKGHTPATALQCIKTEILLNYPDDPLLLEDRSKCPDYDFCYNLYTIFKQANGAVEFNRDGKEVLQQRLEEYNTEVGSLCSKMVMHDDDYIICICSPMMQKVHMYVKAASRMVFMDSVGTLDHNGSRVFVLLTLSECGCLPLGIMITSSDNCEVFEIGFNILKEILGENIFGGFTYGPSIFITDDSQSVQNAIRRCFPSSKIFLCVFHVLQAVWRWLAKSINGIPLEKKVEFFQDFKKIMFAKTESDAELNYNFAIGNICDKYQNYATHLEGYWARREEWVVSYRRGTFVEGHNTNDISEAFVKILKDKIFERIRGFNVMQMVDFILTQVNLYFQRRLLDAVNGRSHTSYCKPVTVPSLEIVTEIKKLADDILWIPSEDIKKHYYTVNMAVLICSCVQGNAGKTCKHIYWGSMVCPSENCLEAINSDSVRRLYYFIATDEQHPKNCLQNLDGSQRDTALNDFHHSEEMDLEDVNHETEEEMAGAVCAENMSEITNDDLISEIKDLLTDLSNRSPNEMRKGLEEMCKELKKMKTPSMCTSLLCKLNKGVMAASTEKASITFDEGGMRCFVCDGAAIGRYYMLATCRTQTSKIRVIEKLGQLVGERYRVVISADDIICCSCADLINTLDCLETEMGSVRNVVLQYLEKKYGLEEGELLNNKTLEPPVPQVLPASPPTKTAPATEPIMSHKRKAAIAEPESEHQNSIDTLTSKRVKDNPKKFVWMEHDKHKYATNFNFCTAKQIGRCMKKKKKQPDLCEFCGGEIKAGSCSNNCSLKERTDTSQSSTSGTQNCRPLSESSCNFGRQASNPFSENMNCPSVSETGTVQMLASEVNEYITATTEETVVTSADDDNAVFLHVVEVGKGDEVHDAFSVPEQVFTVANDGIVELMEVIWNEMDSSHVSSAQDVQVLA